MSFASVGVHARYAALQAADKQAVQTAHVEAVELMVGGNDLDDIDAYRAAGVNTFHARLYTEEPPHDGGMTVAKDVMREAHIPRITLTQLIRSVNSHLSHL